MGLRFAVARWVVAAAALAAAPGFVAFSDASQGEVDLAAAQKQFVTSCGVCHTVEPGAPARQGPSLSGIFGRKAGAVAGFSYSQALATSDFVWDEATLDRWIENAQAMRPGVTMAYRQADPAKRRLIIAYLKSVSTKD
jgi:cytochrome c